MKRLLKPLHWIYVIYALITFVLIMLLIFPFVVLASFMGRIRGGNTILRLCTFWADSWFFLTGILYKKIEESPVDLQDRQFIFVTNHISYLDSALLVKTHRKPFRPLAKAEMGKIPIFGLIYRNATVTVDRTDSSNRANSVRILKSIIGKGISVLVFPEGTFNTTGKPLKSFYDGAFRLAIETQTPVRPVLFLDTYSRMNYKSIFSLNPGRCRVVYMEEIPVSGLQLKDVEKLKQEVYSKMEERLIFYKAQWII